VSAVEHLNPDEFFRGYHGTTHAFSPGDIITPHRALHGPSTGRHVYLTRDPGVASEYAGFAAEQLDDMGAEHGEEKVFEVEALGNVGPDASGIDPLLDLRTSEARVLREVNWKGEAVE